jgi:hypothetical protein
VCYLESMKRCAKCKVEQPFENFAKNKKTADGLQFWCRTCKKANDAEYYQANKDKYKRYSREQYERINAVLTELKSRPCTDCGRTFPPYCMDFDHLEDEAKRFNVGNARKYSVKALLEEVKKCDLVCAVCHRIRTHNRAMVSSSNQVRKLDSQSSNTGSNPVGTTKGA